jgi:hypothetical protein
MLGAVEQSLNRQAAISPGGFDAFASKDAVARHPNFPPVITFQNIVRIAGKGDLPAICCLAVCYPASLPAARAFTAQMAVDHFGKTELTEALMSRFD